MTKTTAILAICCFLSALGQINADLYLSALPAIAHTFNASIHDAQWSVSFYLLGYAVSQLLYGIASDAVGRKKPLSLGLLCLITGNLLCFFSPSLAFFWGGRLIEGLGAGSAVVLTRVILRDLYRGETLSRYFSFLGLAALPVIASSPLLGALILTHADWPAIFLFLLGYALLAFLAVTVFLPETHTSPSPLRWNALAEGAKTLFKSTHFLSLALIIFSVYASIMACLTAAPALIQVKLGHSPMDLGALLVLGGGASFLGLLINARLVIRYGMDTMILLGLLTQLIGALALLLLAFTQPLTLVFFGAPMIWVFFGAGFLFPNVMAMALNPFATLAGLAGSVFSLFQIIGGVSASSIVAEINETTAKPLALLLTLLVSLSLLSWTYLKLFTRHSAPESDEHGTITHQNSRQ